MVGTVPEGRRGPGRQGLECQAEDLSRKDCPGGGGSEVGDKITLK